MTPGILVLGSINTDLVIHGPRLPAPGETVLGGTFQEAPGGKGANQAVAASRAATQPDAVTLIAAVGDDDFGRGARQRLGGEGIDCRHVKTASGQATGVALIMVDPAGENCISVASGANAHLLPEDIEALPEEVFRRARVFLAPLESPSETVRCALERARAAGLVTILNPAPADAEFLTPDVLHLVDVLTPNAGEAALLAGAAADDREAAARAARELQRRGCRHVVVTRGADGCLVADAESAEHVPARPVQAVDATAAGDAFNGALAVALAEGQSLTSAARWATAAAALTVTARGAQPSLPRRGEIDGLA